MVILRVEIFHETRATVLPRAFVGVECTIMQLTAFLTA